MCVANDDPVGVFMLWRVKDQGFGGRDARALPAILFLFLKPVPIGLFAKIPFHKINKTAHFAGQ
jgi:hypothetical protein